jgi:hypothetical protein
MIVTREADAVSGSGHRVGAPNGKPHLVLTRRTNVDTDVGVGSFRQAVDARDVHVFSAPAHRQFSAAGRH